jgi:hypothetical protein
MRMEVMAPLNHFRKLGRYASLHVHVALPFFTNANR